MRSSRDPHARKPFRLLVLGGAALVDAGGAVVAEQRRRLALLTLIAAGRGQGVSRDKLVSYLSPESSTESAKHALHQLLYYLRQQAGDEALLGTDSLRLNPDVITSDVDAFEELLDQREFERAVALYRGPFLDGFHVADSATFEEWASAERARLGARHVDALYHLAAAADESGDHSAAIAWWTRLAGLDPLSSRAARGLISSQAAAGDVPAALRAASTYETIHRAEFDTGPDAEFVASVEALENRGRSATPTLQSAARPVETSPAPSTWQPTVEARPQTRRFTPLAYLGLVLLVAIGMTTYVMVKAPKTSGTNLVAIMPFQVTAADSEGAWLREGLGDLLQIRFAEQRASSVADTPSVLASWQRVNGLSGQEQSLPDMLARARALGASQVVSGSVVSRRNMLLLSAELIDVESERVLARVETRGLADSIIRLVDTLAVRLVSIQGGEDMLRAGVLGANSVPAVRAYLEGRNAMRRGEWQHASEHFDRALDFDSTFASAALGLRRASGSHNGMRSAFAESVAWRHQGKLGPRERSVFLAELGPNYPAWFPTADRLRAWRRVTSSDFDNADAWHQLGLLYYFSGARLGIPDAMHEARIALERALEFDSTRGVPFREHLVAIAAGAADSALLERLLVGVPDDPDDQAARIYHQWLRAFVHRDSHALHAVRPALARVSRADLGNVFNFSQLAGYDVEDAVRATAIILARSRSSADFASIATYQYHLALNRGRPHEAQQAAPRLFPEWRPLSRLATQVLGGMYGDGDTVAANAAARLLAPEVTRPLATEPAERRSQMIHVCVSAQWSLSHGDTHTVDAALTKLRTPEPGAVGGIVSFYATCTAAIEAWRAVIERRTNAPILVARLDSIILTGVSWHWALSEHRIAARLWESMGKPTRALAAVRRRRLDISNYLGADLREEGRLALAAADTVGALRAWRHLLVLRTDPEPEMRGEVERVRQLVTELGRTR